MFNEMMPMSSGGVDIDKVISELELTTSSTISLSGTYTSSGWYNSPVLNASDYGLKYVLGIRDFSVSSGVQMGTHRVLLTFPDPTDKTKFQISALVAYANTSCSISGNVWGYAEPT